jgi:alpha-1,2-mannosyltransferase
VTRRALIVAACAVVTAALLVWASVHHGFFDSKVYSGAVRYWFRDGGMVYDWLRPGTPYGFTYPPFAGLLMAPMAFLPFPVILVIACLATVVSTAVLTWWLVAPLVRKKGWTKWFAGSVAVALALCFEPVRETFGFGQVNTLLLALVAGDVLFGVARGRRWAGVGIGLATAIKLTPGVFILYLLVTRQWRAAGTAIGAAAAATLVAAWIFPDEAREFWTAALWDTNRVGNLEYLSNQSLRGMLARLPVDGVESKLWIVGVLLTLGFWFWRVRAAARNGDHFGGLALTGLLGCLISPVTWIHHCVWLLPAIVRCVEAGLTSLPAPGSTPAANPIPEPATTPASTPAAKFAEPGSTPAANPSPEPATTPSSEPAAKLNSKTAADPSSEPGVNSGSEPGVNSGSEPAATRGGERITNPATPDHDSSKTRAGDRRSLWLGASSYIVLSSHLTWLWETGPKPPLAFLGSNLYVWFSLALLIGMPVTSKIRTDETRRPMGKAGTPDVSRVVT